MARPKIPELQKFAPDIVAREPLVLFDERTREAVVRTLRQVAYLRPRLAVKVRPRWTKLEAVIRLDDQGENCELVVRTRDCRQEFHRQTYELMAMKPMVCAAYIRLIQLTPPHPESPPPPPEPEDPDWRGVE